jgi:TrmH family RNA methyltransferase
MKYLYKNARIQSSKQRGFYMLIESIHNNIIKQIISLQDKKNRDEQKLFIVEGYKQVQDIPESWDIEYIICTEKYKDISFHTDKIYITTDTIFKKIADTKTPQGILAVVKKQEIDLESISNNKGFFVIVENLQDPGNLGSIVRTAEAYNCKGIFLSKNTVDAFSSKVVRSTMGTIFNVPIFQECDINLLLENFKKKNIKTYALALQTDKLITNTKFEDSIAIIVGNEANGISKDILDIADNLIKIEMLGKTQSLNASIACSIAIYEISKQISVI